MSINKSVFEGKSLEEITKKASDMLKVSEDEIIVSMQSENVKGLFGIGSKLASAVVIKNSDIAEYARTLIVSIVEEMNITVLKSSVKFVDNNVFLNIDTSENAILIGKAGRTLQSLQLVVGTALRDEVSQYIRVTLDVGNYRDKRVKQLQKLAHNVGASVAKTKIETKLDSMNSFERRIVHEYLSNDKFVETTSVGDEPNRCVVVKPKK